MVVADKCYPTKKVLSRFSNSFFPVRVCEREGPHWGRGVRGVCSGLWNVDDSFFFFLFFLLYKSPRVIRMNRGLFFSQ